MKKVLKVFLTMLILASFINCYTKDIIPITELKPNCKEDIVTAYSKTGKSFIFPNEDGYCSNSVIIGITESGEIVNLPFAELSAVVVKEIGDVVGDIAFAVFAGYAIVSGIIVSGVFIAALMGS